MNRTFIIVALVSAATLALALIWRPRHVRSFADYFLRNEMPIWLSLALAIFAAGGTYLIAPLINQDFEFQKNRSTHVLNTVTEVNNDIVSLFVATRKFDDSLFFARSDISTRRGEVLDKITELEWKMIDVGVIIRRSGADDKCVGAMIGRLDMLHNVVVKSSSPMDQNKVAEAGGNVGAATKSCLNVLYFAADIS